MAANYISNWEVLLAPMRWKAKPFAVEDVDPVRSPYLVDYDRLIFSSSFRRLSRKTQVHPLVRNDHIHNRLSHSLEVSCVGRSLGTEIGCFLREQGDLPAYTSVQNIGEIVQAACLAHDIGNPPFGHAGESAMRDWFRSAENERFLQDGNISEVERSDFRAFDGNAQGFRVLTAIEMHKDDGGFRLTYPTLASVVKYPCSAHEALAHDKNKFNYYTSEKAFFDAVFTALGLKRNNRYVRHPLSYLAEVADDICYRIIDMEDALELKIISYADIRDVIVPITPELCINEARLKDMETDRRRIGYLRAVLINYLVKNVCKTFAQNYATIMDGNLNPIIEYCDPSIKEYMNNASHIFKEKIMCDQSKTALEIGSYSLYKQLLEVFITASNKTILRTPLNYREERALSLMGSHAPAQPDSLYEAYRRVIDFISGMTDSYATSLASRFSGIF